MFNIFNKKETSFAMIEPKVKLINYIMNIKEKMFKKDYLDKFFAKKTISRLISCNFIGLT